MRQKDTRKVNDNRISMSHELLNVLRNVYNKVNGEFPHDTSLLTNLNIHCFDYVSLQLVE